MIRSGNEEAVQFRWCDASQLHISEYVVRHSVIELKGRVDLKNVREIESQLNDLFDAGLREFVIDLSAILFIDCNGLAVLKNLMERTRRCGGSMRIVPPDNVQAQRMFKLNQMDRLFEMVNSAEILFPEHFEMVHSAPALTKLPLKT